MRCRKARELLTAYLAGECRYSEAAALERHLAGCPQCAAELESLRGLDRLLDLWPDEPAPAGLWNAVLAEVGQLAPHGANQAGAANPPGRGVSRIWPGMLRDLVVAAAVSMVIFWGGGAWLDGGRLLEPGRGIGGAVSAYTRAAGAAVERANNATGLAGAYARQILFEEWEENEMHKSPGK